MYQRYRFFLNEINTQKHLLEAYKPSTAIFKFYCCLSEILFSNISLLSSDHLFKISASRVIVTKNYDYEIILMAVNVFDSRKTLLLLILTGKGQFALFYYPKRCLNLMYSIKMSLE